MRCSALQCVAVRCSAVQCSAVQCSALQRTNSHIARTAELESHAASAATCIAQLHTNDTTNLARCAELEAQLSSATSELACAHSALTARTRELSEAHLKIETRRQFQVSLPAVHDAVAGVVESLQGELEDLARTREV